MPSDWFSQFTYSSSNPRTIEKTHYLRIQLEEILKCAIYNYYTDLSDADEGTKVTLACLNELGEKCITSLASASGKKNETIKQDIGLLVPILLGEYFGKNNVETYRNTRTFRASTRSNTWSQLEWVSRYTPHRVLHLKRLLKRFESLFKKVIV